jgi:ribosomal protein S27AE
MTVGCGFCRAQTQITNSDILDRDTEHACSRCGTRTACPAYADRVVCRGCGLNEPGTASAGARATYRQDVAHGANQWAAARVRVAEEDARARGALPGWAS